MRFALLRTFDPDNARREAERILSQRRFRQRRIPSPFRKQRNWLGDQFRKVFRAIGRVLDGVIPGSSRFAWLVGSALLLALAIFIAKRITNVSLRKRTEEAVRQQTTVTDPDALEHEADLASQRGDFAEALRLRFAAGLARFERARLVTRTTTRTNGEVATRLGSSSGSTTAESIALVTHFDPLARSFDAIRYGDTPATADADAQARAGWQRIRELSGAQKSGAQIAGAQHTDQPRTTKQ